MECLLESVEKMGQIKVTRAPISGLYIIETTVHGDNRGYFY